MKSTASPLARRLIWRLVVACVALSLMATALAVWADYGQIQSRVAERLEQIQSGHVPSVAENMWLQDHDRLESLLIGIRSLPYVDVVELLNEDGHSVMRFQAGYGGAGLIHAYPLYHAYRGQKIGLGQLNVTVSLSEMRKPVLHRAIFILLSNLATVFVSSFVLYVLIRRLVNDPLQQIAAFARQVRLGDLNNLAKVPLQTTRTQEFRDLAVAFDDLVTEITHSYGQLSDSEARYRLIFDASPVSLWEENFAAVKNHLDDLRSKMGTETESFLQMLPRVSRDCAALVQVLDVNKSTIRLHRAASRDDLLGRLDITFTADSYSAFERQLVAIWLNEYEVNHEATVRTMDGDVLNVVIHWFVPRAYRHNYERVIIAIEDVTAQKALEKTLISTVEKMAQVNGELERFAFGASHDLQEPVRSIVSFSQLLERRLKDRLQGDEAELLHFLVAAAQRMQQQIKGLQDYASVTVLPSSFGPLDMNELMHDVVAQISPIIQQTSAQITWEKLPWVYGDKLQLSDLVQQLLLNATTFVAAGVIPMVHVSARSMDQYWCFTVTDNGIGIDDQFAGDVFQLFRRLHGPGHYPGAGIGLATCRRIIDRHGGSIWVAPKQMQGTRICFTVPKRSEDAAAFQTTEKSQTEKSEVF